MCVCEGGGGGGGGGGGREGTSKLTYIFFIKATNSRKKLSFFIILG